MTAPILTQEELKSKLYYNPETGIFTRLNNSTPKYTWKVTGSDDGRGYIQIGVNGKVYRAHRLAWLYVYGEWPKYQIDHINGNKKDNSIYNLQDVTTKINLQRFRNVSKSSTSGLLGVSWDCLKNKWAAYITRDGKRKRVGFFKDKHKAHEAYLLEKSRLNGY